MRSPEQLRAEVRRLHLTIRNTVDQEQRQVLAERALELAQQAEIIENLPNDPEGLRLKIAQHRHMLSGAGSEPRQRMVAQLLRDAEDKLQRVSNQPRAPRPHRVAAGLASKKWRVPHEQ